MAAVVALLLVTGLSVVGRSPERPGANAPTDPRLQVASAEGTTDTAGKGASTRRNAPPAGRPAVLATQTGENGHAPPPPSPGGDYVTAFIQGRATVVSDAALPWQVWLDPDLLAVHDEAIIRASLAAWDGTAGSRWATEVLGVQPGGNEVDDRSTIFLEKECVGLTTANAYVHPYGAIPSERYGSPATYVAEADIGICPFVSSPEELARAIRHEVGHVMGLAHLCDVGDVCWTEFMGSGPSSGCRTMFWEARPCQDSITERDRLAAVDLYPTVRPLTGPGPAWASARASFALWPDGTARAAVVIPTEGGGAGPPAAALAGRLDAPLLVSPPTDGSCLAPVVLEELARVLARRGTLVLVGDGFATGCEALARAWDLRLIRIDEPTDGSLSVAVARTALAADPPGAAASSQATVVLARQRGADGPVAALLAARLGVPLLMLPVGVAPPVILDHLVVAGTTEAWLVGEVGTDADLRSTLAAEGVTSRSVAGPDRVATAEAVAAIVMREAPNDGPPAAILAPADGVHPALIGVAVGARVGASLLARAAPGQPRVASWLQQPGVQAWAVSSDPEEGRELVRAFAPFVEG